MKAGYKEWTTYWFTIGKGLSVFRLPSMQANTTSSNVLEAFFPIIAKILIALKYYVKDTQKTINQANK